MDEKTLLIVAGIIALFLCWAAIKGAVGLFLYAAEQGFIGLAAYVACWVFFFPVMLVICVILGIISMFLSD